MGKFGPKNSKLSFISEHWCAWYLKDADFESRIRSLKFRLQNPFLDKFGPKNSKLSVLSENWYAWCLKDADSYSNISFLNFKSWFPFWENLAVQIPNLDFDFWNSRPKIKSWANLSWKSHSCPFFLKTGMHGMLTMLILIPTLVFWISDPKSIVGKTCAKKVKVAQFGWKLVHRVSRRCWFLFRHYFS